MKYTGERYIPNLESPEISYEHWHRYLYATQFVKGKVVLDIACGEGYGSYLLSETAKYVVGIDISPEVINYAGTKYVRSNLELKVGSVSSIPVDGEAIFDVVVSFETIEHVTEEEQRAFLKEVKRLLRPDGLLIISTPNKLLWSDIPNKNEFHVKEFYIDEFKEFLGNHFKNVKLMGQKIYPVSYIWDSAKNLNTYKEYKLTFSEKGFRPTEDPKNIQYAIAICSDREIEGLESSILVDLSEKMIKLKDNLESALNNIYNSHGWKALLVYYKVRDKILPPNSIRREIIKSILNFNKASLDWKSLLFYFTIRDKIFPPNTNRRKVMKSIRDGLKKALLKKYAKSPQRVEKMSDILTEEIKDNYIQIGAHAGDSISTVIEDLDANLRKNLRIAFVSQPEYFRFMYEALDRDYDTREFVLRWGGDINYYKGLIEFNPNIAFFFRPEIYPDELLETLKGIKVALSSEPIPKYFNDRLLTSGDMEVRFNSLKGVKNKKYDYFFHYDKTSLRFLKENGLKVDGEFFFPVDTRIYRPYDAKKTWDWGFIGRSTSYREKFLGIPKRDLNGLHIAHGVYGEEFVRLMNACKIGINLHIDENVSLEPRVQMMMACKVLTFSDPLTHNEFFKPGIHYVEFTHPEEFIEKLQYYLKHDDEREKIALKGFELVRERLSSRLFFQKLIDQIVIENRERLKESGLSGMSRSRKDYLRLDLGCGRFKRKGFIGVDIEKFDCVDIVADLNEPLKFPDDSTDRIFCSHTLENVKNPIFL